MKTLKNIIKSTLCIAAITATGTAFTSCSDLLDTTPNGVLSEDQVGPEQAVQLMTSAYATLLNHFVGNNESFAAPINNWVMDVRSDDALKGGGGISMEEGIHQLEVGIINSDTQPVTFKWSNCYFSITRCNTAIRAIQASPSIADGMKSTMIAEMKTLRSFYYFELYRIYQKFPYFDETVLDPSEVSASKYSKEQIVNFIKQDLRDAYKALPESQEEVARFDKYVAAALMARVSLFTSSWEEAAEYSGYVINSGKYGLFTNFLDISKPEFNNQQESVFAIQFSSANSPEQYNFNNCLNCTWSEGNLYGNGDDFYLASQNLVNAFRTDDAGLPYLDGATDGLNVDAADFAGNVDPRLDFTVGRIGMPWRSYTYNENWCRAFDIYGEYSGKKPYPSPDSPYVQVGIVPWGASSLNYMVIRYADVLLMRAEALIEMGGDLEEARQLINLVRSRAAKSVDPAYEPIDVNPAVAHYAVSEYPATGWNQAYARKAVRHERRVELALEGHRWFDLLRWGNVVEVMNKYYQEESKIRTYLSGASITESELYFPVPLDQLQNAGGLYN